jgi:uncharacterized damage-inducible protein DinB
MMPSFSNTIASEFVRYLEHLAGRVEKALRSIPREKVYVKPFPFGNSIGHLVLHLTGNLNHYIGAGIAKKGYVRDRPKEFNDPNPPSPDDALAQFREAVAMVANIIRSLDEAAWQATNEKQEHPITTHFGLILVCVSHINNHIGQMAYLVKQLECSTDEPPVW